MSGKGRGDDAGLWLGRDLRRDENGGSEKGISGRAKVVVSEGDGTTAAIPEAGVITVGANFVGGVAGYVGRATSGRILLPDIDGGIAATRDGIGIEDEVADGGVVGAAADADAALAGIPDEIGFEADRARGIIGKEAAAVRAVAAGNEIVFDDRTVGVAEIDGIFLPFGISIDGSV